MSLSKYNFIIGLSSSGKTQVLKKIANSFGIPGIFLDSESGIIVDNNYYKSFSVQNFPECSNLINSIGDIPHFIIIDAIHSLTVSKDKTFNSILKEFFKSLPDQHTYFFSINMNKSLVGVTDDSDYFKNIKRSLSMIVELDIEKISVFESRKINNGVLSPFEIINHDVNESYNIGSIEPLIRDYKINQLL